MVNTVHEAFIYRITIAFSQTERNSKDLNYKFLDLQRSFIYISTFIFRIITRPSTVLQNQIQKLFKRWILNFLQKELLI
jgi:hypothetical protein